MTTSQDSFISTICALGKSGALRFAEYSFAGRNVLELYANSDASIALAEFGIPSHGPYDGLESTVLNEVFDGSQHLFKVHFAAMRGECRHHHCETADFNALFSTLQSLPRRDGTTAIERPDFSKSLLATLHGSRDGQSVEKKLWAAGVAAKKNTAKLHK